MMVFVYSAKELGYYISLHGQIYILERYFGRIWEYKLHGAVFDTDRLVTRLFSEVKLNSKLW